MPGDTLVESPAEIRQAPRFALQGESPGNVSSVTAQV